MASPSTLVTGYYHGLLLKDIDFSLLMDSMHSKDLISADTQKLISTGHSVYQKKWLLFEHVRSKENTFLEFCNLLLKLQPAIGSQLSIGMYIINYVDA